MTETKSSETLERKALTRLDLELIKDYFFGNNRINLDSFTRENRGVYLEIISASSDEGYLFFGELQLDRDYEARMESELSIQKKKGRIIYKKFTDYKERISGFHWRNS